MDRQQHEMMRSLQERVREAEVRESAAEAIRALEKKLHDAEQRASAAEMALMRKDGGGELVQSDALPLSRQCEKKSALDLAKERREAQRLSEVVSTPLVTPRAINAIELAKERRAFGESQKQVLSFGGGQSQRSPNGSWARNRVEAGTRRLQVLLVPGQSLTKPDPTRSSVDGSIRDGIMQAVNTTPDFEMHTVSSNIEADEWLQNNYVDALLVGQDNLDQEAHELLQRAKYHLNGTKRFSKYPPKLIRFHGTSPKHAVNLLYYQFPSKDRADRAAPEPADVCPKCLSRPCICPPDGRVAASPNSRAADPEPDPEPEALQKAAKDSDAEVESCLVLDGAPHLVPGPGTLTLTLTEGRTTDTPETSSQRDR